MVFLWVNFMDYVPICRKLLFMGFLLFYMGVDAQENREAQLFESKELDSLFFFHKQQLKKAQEKNSTRKIAYAYWSLGQFYYKVGVFSEATDQFNRALLQLESKPEDTLKVWIKNTQGSMQLGLRNYEQAAKFFSESIRTAKFMGYLRGVAVSKGLLGSCFEKKGQYQSALRYEKESLSHFEVLNDSSGLAVVNENIGSIYEDLGKYDLAYDYFSKAYSYCEGTYTSLEANILNNLGDIHRKQGAYGKALQFTYRALILATDLKEKDKLRSAYNDISKTYALQGEYEKAFDALREAEQLTSDIFYGQNTNQMNVLQTVYNTNQQETRIKLLEEEYKVAKFSRNFWIVALVLVAVIILGLLVYRGKRRKEELRIQQYEKQLLEVQLEKKALQQRTLQNEIQLKASALSKYSLHLSHKNKILSDVAITLTNLANRKNMDRTSLIKGLANDIKESVQQDEEAKQFQYYFSEIHPEFIRKLSHLGKEKLSPAEIRLAMLLRLHLTSKEIASIFRITPDSIRVARYRLRKKLLLDSEVDLVDFLIHL